ncbi:MAG TPA: ribonuclease P protein component [Candidatus Deferrimicrobium sp.]|nr:ribonuclease P protein component [Candidatus Deferrimicrobium sp.]
MPARNSIPRSQRLKRDAEIKSVIKEGNRITGKYFSAKWEAGDAYKFGIFVSKAHGSAVDRNHLKRLYREAIRLDRHLLRGPVKVAIFPHVKINTPALSQITAEIRRIFSIIGGQ